MRKRNTFLHKLNEKLCSYQRCDLKGKTVDDSLLPAIFRIKKLELK